MRCVKQSQLRGIVVVLLILISFESVTDASISTRTGSVAQYGERSQVIQILAIVPTFYRQSDIDLLPKWKEGEEILPGGSLALKEISNVSDFLNGYQLEVIPIRFPLCDYNEGIVHFVEELTSKENNIVAVVGYFCYNLVHRLSQLLQRTQLRVVQISAMAFNTLDKDFVPGVHSVISLYEPIARAAVQLMQKLDWSTIAVISNQNSNYVEAKSLLLKLAKEQDINVALKVETSNLNNQYLKSFFQQLQSFGIKIIVALVSPNEAVDILCYAHRNGFQWPDYVWIFMGNDISNVIEKANCKHYFRHANITLNNSIFLHPQLSTPYNHHSLPSGLNYSDYYNAYINELEVSATELNLSLQSNLYVNVLYDSIWAIAITLNSSLSILKERNLSLVNISQARGEIFDVLEEQLSTLSFQGATGFLNFSLDSAAVHASAQLIQLKNAQQLHLGVYTLTLDELLLNETVLEDVPSDLLSHIYVLYPIPLMVIVLILILLSFALTTVSMCLFFYYRKQPAIKATSSTLSLCLFIGCYLLLVSSLLHSITSGISVQGGSKSLRSFVCMFDIVCMSLGVDVVFATVIAKTLRIYHIFKKFGKVNRICSDQGLFILISSIVSIKITLLILWICLDIAHLIDIDRLITSSVPPYFLVTQSCESRHLDIWLVLHYGYSTLLALIMVLLAILTRKIKRSNYKDSKKINMLVAVLFLDMCIAVVLWIIFRYSGAPILSRVVYGIGTMTAALSCQSFLILPKVIPLLLRNCQSLISHN